MITITHEDGKHRLVYVKEFKINEKNIVINGQNLGVIEIFFTPELSEALDFETQEKADKVLQELITPSNAKILRIRRKLSPAPITELPSCESTPS